MSYRAPVADIAFALKHASGFAAALGGGLYGELDEATVDAVLEEAGKFASDVIAPLNTVGDKFGTPFKDGKVDHAAGLEGGLHRLGRRRLERARRARRLRRPGAAARGQRRLRRDVEFGLDGLRHRPGADHGGDRRAARLRHRRPQAALSAQSW